MGEAMTDPLVEKAALEPFVAAYKDTRNAPDNWYFVSNRGERELTVGDLRRAAEARRK